MIASGYSSSSSGSSSTSTSSSGSSSTSTSSSGSSSTSSGSSSTSTSSSGSSTSSGSSSSTGSSSSLFNSNSSSSETGDSAGADSSDSSRSPNSSFNKSYRMGSFCSFWRCMAFHNLSRFSFVNFISSARASATSFSGADSFSAATGSEGASLARERFGEEFSSSFSSNKFLEIPNILLFIELYFIFFLNAFKAFYPHYTRCISFV